MEVIIAVVLLCLFFDRLCFHYMFMYVCSERDRLREKLDRMEMDELTP